MLDFKPLVQAIADAVAERLKGSSAALQPRLLSVAQAAVYLGRTEDSVRSLQQSGKLPVVKLDSRVQFDVRDLDRCIDAAKQ